MKALDEYIKELCPNAEEYVVIKKADLQKLLGTYESSKPKVIRHDDPDLCKVGTRVVRNPEHWEWGDQDCDTEGNQTVGTIIEVELLREDFNWATVRWDGGSPWSYRVGTQGKYDLLLAL